jgi:hypothetical protein
LATFLNKLGTFSLSKFLYDIEDSPVIGVGKRFGRRRRRRGIRGR